MSVPYLGNFLCDSLPKYTDTVFSNKKEFVTFQIFVLRFNKKNNLSTKEYFSLFRIGRISREKRNVEKIAKSGRNR